MNLVKSIENQQLKEKAPKMEPGDTVRVHTRIVEGDRERVQVFQGTIIRLRGGNVNANFTVRRIASDGIGVERTFLLHSPRVEKVEVVRHARVRRAQLYYLRGRTGKAARLKARRDERTAKTAVQD
jgi:large subunit ribosomal protein L19